MVDLPKPEYLRDDVIKALDFASRSCDGNSPPDGWTQAIGKKLEALLCEHGPNIRCYFGYKRDRGEEGKEWLLDFTAVLQDDEPFYEEGSRKERYIRQVLVAGEIEWGDNLGLDFEKLLAFDSLVYFFAFNGAIRREHGGKEAEFFERLAARRIQDMKQRGITPKPVFIVSCYSSQRGNFDHRIVAPQVAD